eukprot:GHVP01027910.1.p1 GENE.GHVP01027910.1~~GHVP01027910.1.p1  ORF type:complete len:132 (-),score=12.24 GHVP01027910.1:219-614(-)
MTLDPYRHTGKQILISPSLPSAITREEIPLDDDQLPTDVPHQLPVSLQHPATSNLQIARPPVLPHPMRQNMTRSGQSIHNYNTRSRPKYMLQEEVSDYPDNDDDYYDRPDDMPPFNLSESQDPDPQTTDNI